jgi:site-specific DNA-cytosine methylase
MRRITPREATRLQGLPTDLFADAELGDAAAYKQLGNAVNVGVVKAAARALFGAGKATWLAAPPVKLRRVI